MVSWITVPTALIGTLLLATGIIFRLLARPYGEPLVSVTSAFLGLGIACAVADVGYLLSVNLAADRGGLFGARLMIGCVTFVALETDRFTRRIGGRPRSKLRWYAIAFALAAAVLSIATPLGIRGSIAAPTGFSHRAGHAYYAFGPLMALVGLTVPLSFVTGIWNCLGRGAASSARPMGYAMVVASILELPDFVQSFGLVSPMPFAGVGFIFVILAGWAALWRATMDRERQRDEMSDALVTKSREVAHAQAALLQAEKLLSLGRLAASVAHQVNNPSGFILANLDHLRTLLPNADEATTRALDDSVAGVRRIREIVSALHDIARGDDSPREPISLQRITESALLLAGPSMKHGIEVRPSLDETPMFLGRRGPLMRVVLDLVGHAMDCVPFGESARIDVRTWTSDGEVILVVKDDLTASRIADETMGMRLRLEGVRATVHAAGGTLIVGERDVDGMVRTMRLPVEPLTDAAIPNTQAPPARMDRKRSPTRARVLLIDDEDALLRVLGRILERDHQTFTAHDADEARAIANRHGSDLDLVVCDVVMADTNGLALYENLCEICPELRTRFVFITGGGLAPGFAERLQASGCPVLEKPLEPDQLLRLVAERVRPRPSLS